MVNSIADLSEDLGLDPGTHLGELPTAYNSGTRGCNAFV